MEVFLLGFLKSFALTQNFLIASQQLNSFLMEILSKPEYFTELYDKKVRKASKVY